MAINKNHLCPYDNNGRSCPLLIKNPNRTCALEVHVANKTGEIIYDCAFRMMAKSLYEISESLKNFRNCNDIQGG